MRFEQINQGLWHLIAGDTVIGKGYDPAQAFADAVEQLAATWRDHNSTKTHYHPHPVPPAG